MVSQMRSILAIKNYALVVFLAVPAPSYAQYYYFSVKFYDSDYKMIWAQTILAISYDLAYQCVHQRILPKFTVLEPVSFTIEYLSPYN